MAKEQGRGISRRTLLVGGGAGIGLAIAWSLWPRTYRPNLRAAEGETLFNAFLKIARDGRVIVAVPQAEVGQGVYTSLPQILADELGADWRTVSVEPAPISPLYANVLLAEEASADSPFPATFGVDRWAARRYAARVALMITGGSTSVRAFEPRLREAGAAARALLSKAAAERWGNVAWEDLDTRAGFVRGERGRLSFAELAETAAAQELPENLPVRGGLENRLVGQSLPRLDLPAKIDGSATFAGDVRLPDMVYAAVRGAPEGSRRSGMDRPAADAVPGALSVVEHGSWTAVIGSNWWAAARALDALRPTYEVPTGGPSAATVRAALTEAVEGGEAESVFELGDVAGPFAGASPVTARYYVGPAPSAPVEPLTATARLIGDLLEIWAPTQAPALARAAAARAAGLTGAQVTIYPMLVGGGYGRKLETEAIEQAAVLAVQLERPVQVVWPRIQEIQRDTLRPPASARMTAWIGQAGIAAWSAKIAAPAAAQVAARLDTAAGFFRPDGGATAGAVPPYGIPNVAVDHVEMETGLRTGIWRGGAHSYTCFFTECFLDELARLAGMEPLGFRMSMLAENPRLARVLTTATSIGGWDGGQPGSGMGLAAHSAFGSHIATLAEVEITREQRLRVLRAVCAVDVGRIVNPEIVKQQIEGGIIHGIAAATGNMLEIVNGIPQPRTIGAYRLPILRDAPEVTVELLESEEDPGGVTELGVPTAAPAIANALFSLTGQRLRALPLAIGGGA